MSGALAVNWKIGLFQTWGTRKNVSDCFRKTGGPSAASATMALSAAMSTTLALTSMLDGISASQSLLGLEANNNSKPALVGNKEVPEHCRNTVCLVMGYVDSAKLCRAERSSRVPRVSIQRPVPRLVSTREMMPTQQAAPEQQVCKIRWTQLLPALVRHTQRVAES